MIEGILREISCTEPSALRAYLGGASRDCTYNSMHRTFRFTQKDRDWLLVLQAALSRLGSSSWIYREGARVVWALETSFEPEAIPSYLSLTMASPWARGYFDAEGGCPYHPSARFYVQLAQKNKEDLCLLRDTLERLNIRCGRLHNPSQRVDPHYWRFFVRARSHRDFAQIVDSWHPRKRMILRARLSTQAPEAAAFVASKNGEWVNWRGAAGAPSSFVSSSAHNPGANVGGTGSPPVG